MKKLVFLLVFLVVFLLAFVFVGGASAAPSVVSTTQTSATVEGLACGSKYRFEIRKYNADGSLSSTTSFVEVQTKGCPDTKPPSAPQDLAATGVTQTSISVSWSASTDDVGVAGYDLYRGGAKVDSTNATSYTYAGLSCGTSYTLAVAAFDAAGNESNRAEATTVRATLACPVIEPVTTFKNVFGTDSWVSSEPIDIKPYGYAIANMWHHNQLKPDADAAGTMLAVYQCMSSARDARWGTSAGIPWDVAQAHPEWFLLDQNGQRIEWAPWPGSWQMDVGNVAYQNQWAENVIARAKADGWKAVTIDNAMIDPVNAGYWSSTRKMAKYPTVPEIMEAYRSFFANVGPKLKAAGLHFMPNVQSWTDPVIQKKAITDWGPHVSGIVREHWMRWACDGCGIWGGQDWLNRIREFEEVQRLGKDFYTGTHNGGTIGVQAARYGYASFLIGWKGVVNAVFDGGESEKSWMVNIGTPTEERRLYGTNVWGKPYTGGLALANIGSSPQTVSLGGSYRHPNGSVVTTVTLAGTDGIVLRNP